MSAIAWFRPTEKRSDKILRKRRWFDSLYLKSRQAGIAECENVSNGGAELTVTASYTPTDAVRDFVDAVASLRTVASAHCCWFQEPGEMHWQFLRSKDRVTVEVIHFAGLLMPGRYGPDGVSVFKADTYSLGSDGYTREWRHSFPLEACEKLETAIREAESDE